MVRMLCTMRLKFGAETNGTMLDTATWQLMKIGINKQVMFKKIDKDMLEALAGGAALVVMGYLFHFILYVFG